jgi:hypothetical protein
MAHWLMHVVAGAPLPFCCAFDCSDETAKVVAEAKFKQMKEAYEDLVRQAST